VTWSLFYEMTFYLAFPLARLSLRNRVAIARRASSRRRGGGARRGRARAVLVASVRGRRARLRGRRVAAHSGVVVHRAYLAITTLAALDALPPTWRSSRSASWPRPSSRLRARANVVARVFETAPLRALGRVSYSFYLVHWMIVVLVARAVEGAPAAMAAATIFAGGFALSAAAATALWWVAERPYFARARRCEAAR
jgi:peptidoglycan/LPS O-acetylase OafA/YrhL